MVIDVLSNPIGANILPFTLLNEIDVVHKL